MRGVHHNAQLQSAFDKHGEDAYVFDVSLLCPVEDLDMQEQFALDIYHGTPGCANVAKCAEVSARGRKHSEEARAKMSESHRGVFPSTETRARMSRSQKGRRHSAESRAKMSEVQKGRTFSDESRARMSASQRGKRQFARHPNIRVERTDGSFDIWPSLTALSANIGHKSTGAVSYWLSGRDPIPAKYNILSVSRTELPVTINPEAI